MTWRQIENDLTEFKSSLDKDRGTLHKIEDALKHQKSDELLCNIKNAAKLFTETGEITNQVRRHCGYLVRGHL
jgi:hypothetical protein